MMQYSEVGLVVKEVSNRVKIKQDKQQDQSKQGQ